MSLFQKEEPKQYESNGHQIVCQICGNTHFWVRKSEMAPSAGSILNLDVFSKETTCFVCSECRHIEWFLV